GLNQQTGNYPGVTVEKHSGEAFLHNPDTNETIQVDYLDLPGTYSIYPKTLDEEVCYKILCDETNEDHPDITIIVADATNLRRSLFLATQIIDLGLPCIFVMNMIDFAKIRGVVIDSVSLAESLGIPVLSTNARKRVGIESLEKLLINEVHRPKKTFINVKQFMDSSFVDSVQKMFPQKSEYAVFQVINNEAGIEHFEVLPTQKIDIKRLIKANNYDKHKVQSDMTIARYKTINEIVKNSVAINEEEKRKSLSARIDRVLTHRVWGYAIFLVILFLIFQSIFFIATYPMNAIEFLFVKLSEFGRDILPTGELSALLINGILAGLSGVVVFVPQIALLFAFIIILEDTGYMARVSFLMDRLMRPLGLNGRSVIPLMSGMACAVPAIMGTRTIPNWKERMITIMVTPLMSCSARLPVYTLLISLVIPSTHNYGYFNLQGLVLMGMYLLGFVSALSAAAVLKLLIKTKEKSYFIMEMPLYHIPKPSIVFLTIYQKVKVFLFDAGKVIIAISVILWVMASHGPPSKINAIETAYHNADSAKKYTPKQIETLIASEKLKVSYASIGGKWIEPAIRPLGFDWKIGIALITSFAAREVFVGTMATLYSAEGADNSLSIREKMASAVNSETGLKEYTPAVGFSLMLFYAFAMQCMSTLAVVYRETKNIKWPIIQFFYMGALAWLASFLVYNLAK
ncbi:MAG TPA: ferrous iron transport protein B, partial [Bacteroidia bacterium]|nr:ferrous iron transport protein B [Bacteroidia bacterium]